ncbi:uncharacterized protein LOC126789166 [Argentina anserina]|uniref:uncharacterized protein LOC126789166 n=1 Tax=Argentina anserina TaxID=57926 RepID=UPI00217685FD|nr:uncharacterized protein LOC126789166 [Potentilla anserina]
MNPISMAGWISNNAKVHYKAVDANEMFLGLPKSAGLDLIQNCDLPPPMKVFTGSADKTVVSSINRICSMTTPEDHENSHELTDMYGRDGRQNYEKLELLKALRLSQTRAREAEKKAEKLAREKECLSNDLLAEAKELFAYRQWVRLLELKVSELHSQFAEQEHQECCGCETWIVALALCLGFAGVGFAFGSRYLY